MPGACASTVSPPRQRIPRSPFSPLVQVCVPDFPMYNSSPVSFVKELPKWDVSEYVAESEEPAVWCPWCSGKRARVADAKDKRE